MTIKHLFTYCIVLVVALSCQQPEPTKYDIVITGARVIDPETKTDSLLNVGLIGDKIVAISGDNLIGNTTIDATGLVLSAGFIDLHAHGQTNVENAYQAFDGVTTALELEVGVDTLKEWLAARTDRAILNFGASACQLVMRNKILTKASEAKNTIYDELADKNTKKPLAEGDFKELRNLLKDALLDGAIGVGVPVGYIPDASIEEIGEVYAFAAENNVPIFSHIREGGAIAFQQAIADAVVNGTTLHLCHINSMARKDIAYCLELVEKAQKQGLPITTELYPYTAGNTNLASAVFDAGWEERLGCTYQDLQWVETGERLTPETFAKYRKTGGSVIVHMMKKSWIDLAIQSPTTMIASDGAEFSPMGHPRSSGTFSKIFAEYVREKQLITLTQAIEKMTLMPAQLLEKFVPEMKKRGRVQVGCFADLCLFDPTTMQDKSTYKRGFEKAEGVKYLLVNGTLLIDDGKLQKDTFPGKAIKGELK